MGSALRDRIAAIKADRAGNGPTQSTAIGVQQAIEAERAAKAQAQNAAAVQTPAMVAAQSVFGPVNPPEGAHAVVGDVEPLAENFKASGEPLPPAEAPTQPDAPQAKRRGRPPGSKNKVKGGHEVVTYTPSAEECAAAEEARVPDTIPAPTASDDEIARRVLRLLATTLLTALNEEDAQ